MSAIPKLRSQSSTLEDEISKVLQARGLSQSNDVKDIFPAPDYMQLLVSSGIFDSWNFGIALTSNGASVKDFRTAIEKTLSNNTIFTALCVADESKDLHYVTLKPSPKLWDICIVDGGSVQSNADLLSLSIDYPYPDKAKLPGPLFHCLIVHVEESNSAAMVFYLHHLVHDSLSLPLFYDDIERSLSRPLEELHRHNDYKDWADAFHSVRNSATASESVDFHTRRLSSLHLHRWALYPPAPLAREPATDTVGLYYKFNAPGLPSLKEIARNADITPDTVLKAAIALVNVHRTGHTHAIFSSVTDGRTPLRSFGSAVQRAQTTTAELTNLYGPTMQGVCDLIEIPHGESAAQFLRRMQANQLELLRHEHAPIRHIIDNLNGQNDKSGDLIIDAHRAQFFVWSPAYSDGYEQIGVLQMSIRCTVGLVVVGWMEDEGTSYALRLRWDGANFSRDRARGFAGDIETTISWLTRVENRDKPIAGLLSEIGETHGK
ncbi:hypothetical protein PT974_04471 [Cladobotryum mycophilum]|uniref:Condensation domain-containing protein n=1 Tax=Cladobotryum mycophilum TaxID=491253 RepID=A0ABR0SWB6_9HYPO